MQQIVVGWEFQLPPSFCWNWGLTLNFWHGAASLVENHLLLMFKINNKTTLPSLKRKQKHKTLASKTLNFNVLYAEKEVYRSQCRKKKLQVKSTIGEYT